MSGRSSARAKREPSKLECLASAWAMSVTRLLEEYGLDEVVPGICMNPDCEYTTGVEPGEREGWCGACGATSVRSCLVLAGLI
jgi:hypothetical protein